MYGRRSRTASRRTSGAYAALARERVPPAAQAATAESN